MGAIEQIFLAATLAACSGIRAFSPLVIICFAARQEHFNPRFINPDIAPLILRSDVFFYIILGCAIFEIVADFLPSMANFMDAFHLILRPIAGILASFTVLNMNDTVLNYVLAFGLGALLTLPIQSFRANCRMMSSAPNSTTYNLYLSITEDILALGGAIVAFIKPALALPFMLPLIYFVLTSFKKWRQSIIVGDEEEEQIISEGRSDSEIMEIQRLKKMKKDQGN